MVPQSLNNNEMLSFIDAKESFSVVKVGIKIITNKNYYHKIILNDETKYFFL